jgi:hypothetical protein
MGAPGEVGNRAGLAAGAVLAPARGADGGRRGHERVVVEESPADIDNSDYLDELQDLYAGIVEDWTSNRAYCYTKYDARHFIENFCNMSSAPKTSEMYKVFIVAVSDALFRILPGERARIIRHVRKLGMSRLQIKKLRRRYWRLRARYTCPEPKVIVKGLFDVYYFFRSMPDPDCEKKMFFKSDHKKIFEKEIRHVQLGLYSLTRRASTCTIRPGLVRPASLSFAVFAAPRHSRDIIFTFAPLAIHALVTQALACSTRSQCGSTGAGTSGRLSRLGSCRRSATTTFGCATCSSISSVTHRSGAATAATR